MSNVLMYGGAPFPGRNPLPRKPRNPLAPQQPNSPLPKKRKRHPMEPFPSEPVSPRAAPVSPGEPIGNVGQGVDASAEIALANFHMMLAFSLALVDADDARRAEMVAALARATEALGELAAAFTGK